MPSLYFDISSGVAGDMLLASLIDLGLDFKLFQNNLSKLNLPEIAVKHFFTKRSSIQVSRFEVICKSDDRARAKEESHDHSHGHDHEHSHHHHDHSSGHSHSHAHSHDHEVEEPGHVHHHEHRNLKSIEGIINGSTLSNTVKQNSLKVFRQIALVESKAHGVGIEEIHFHEVGAIDSIVDVIGFCIALEMLKVDSIYFNEFHFGKGHIHCAHGKMPLPVPAVSSLTNGYSFIQTNVPSELTTPTGAAILTTLGKQVDVQPPGKAIMSGYGAGSREPKGIFGALRALLFEKGKLENEHLVIQAEVNIDDMTSESVSYLCEVLLKKFKQDVWVEPIQMKKNRPAFKIYVLLLVSELDVLKDLLFKHSTTFGFRYQHMHKYEFERESVSFRSSLGECRMKVGHYGGEQKFSAEYEDCKSISQQRNIPIDEVMSTIHFEFKNR